jgi:2-aminoadipate transaminase
MGEFKFDRWANLYAQRISSIRSSVIRDLISVAVRPDIISFAGGLPHPKSFPVPEIDKAIKEVLKNNSDIALQYGPSEGHLGLREEICKMMSEENIKVYPDEILITEGAQQALDLIGKIFINPGDCIILEAPSYVGAINAFAAYEVNAKTIPLDEDGIRIDKLENEMEKLKKKNIIPKFLYVIPNFQNPAGVTLSQERRDELIALSTEYNLLVIEDNPYGSLCFEGTKFKSLKLLDQGVTYLGTFSKILTPGLRTGWVAAPKAIIEKLIQVKQAADLCGSAFNQKIIEAYLRNNDLNKHIEKIIKMYKLRRDVMLEALEEFFPEEATWTEPRGGLFLWATLPKFINTDEMLADAIEEKVAYVPGSAFYPDGKIKNSMRLNFSFAEPEDIKTGIKRLAKVIKDQISIVKSFYKMNKKPDKKGV